MKNVTLTQDEYDSLLSSVSELKTTIEELKLKNIEQEHTIDHLTERLRLALQRGFGKSSEKIDPNQLTIPEIFNEPEVLVDVSIPEPKAEEVFTEVKGHVRKKTHLKDRLPDDIPVEEHHHRELKEGDTCPICGYQLVKYRTRANLAFCKERHIELSVPKLGRPSKSKRESTKDEWQDNTDRIEVEHFFSVDKRCNGAGLIKTKLEETAMRTIAMAILVTNLFAVPTGHFFVFYFQDCFDEDRGAYWIEFENEE